MTSARSALSAIIPLEHGVPFGERPLVSKFVRGVSNIRPPLPKYTSIWNVNQLLNHFRVQPDNENLSLKDLTHKVTTLLCLVLCQRAQTIHSFDLNSIKFDGDGVHIGFPSRLKTTRPHRHFQPIFIPSFSAESTICPVQALQTYVQHTSGLRGQESKLLISYIKPHKGISSKSVSRWLKLTLRNAGIDTSIFQGHSVRAAGSSKAKASGVPINNILKMAGWATASTFARHYEKPIQEDVTGNILLPSAL